MPDTFGTFTIKRRDFGSGQSFVTRGTVPGTGPYVFDDGDTPPAAGFEYHLDQTTANNVVVPYNDVSISGKSPGDLYWARGLYPTHNNQSQNIAQSVLFTSTNDVVVAGVQQGPMDFGSGIMGAAGTDYLFVTKLAQGTSNPIWVKQFVPDSTSNPHPNALPVIVRDSSDKLYLAGMVLGVIFLKRLTSDGSTDWSNDSVISGAANAIAINSTGTWVVIATSNGVLVKCSTTDGAIISQHSCPPSAQVNNLSLDTSDNIYICGTFFNTVNFGTAPGDAMTVIGSSDMYISKFDSSFTFIKSVHYGGTGTQTVAQGIDSTSTRVAISGTYQNGPLTLNVTYARPDSANAFICSFDSNLLPVWSWITVPSFYASTSQSVRFDSVGNINAAVITNGVIVGDYAHSGSLLPFVFSFKPNGDRIWYVELIPNPTGGNHAISRIAVSSINDVAAVGNVYSNSTEIKPSGVTFHNPYTDGGYPVSGAGFVLRIKG